MGVLGGTFDPVHLGHLVAASELHHALDLDLVVLVPAGRPWQKADRDVADDEHRIRMAELACVDDPRFAVSRVDVDRPGPTYSIDTVADLQGEHGPDVELTLLLGADAVAGLPGWHRVDELLAQVRVVGCTRPGHAAVVPPGIDAERVRFVPTTPIDLSSTELRARVARGEPIRYLVSSAVERYVAEHDLYRTAA